jgi:hypothetical protein
MKDDRMNDHAREPFWRSRSGIVVAGFLAIAGFLVLVEHAAHVYELLPYLLILACPLMHLFHHRGGHGGHHRGDNSNEGTAR